MNRNEILSLIQRLEYDLDTICCLIDYGRINDSVPILERVLNRIQSFRAGIKKDGPHNLEGVFLDSFWDKEIQDGLKAKDLLLKIKESLDPDGIGSEKELEKMGYVNFFWSVRSWISDSIFLLKQRIKSPFRKKVEAYSVVFVVSLIGVCAAWFLVDTLESRHRGLQAEFYNGINLDNYAGTSSSKTIDFSSCGDMDSHTASNIFSARWQGELMVPQDGQYTFTVLMDDGARLFIDDKLMLESWQPNDSVKYFKKVFLQKGAHRIRLEYVNLIGGCVLRLYWEGPGIDQQIIPEQYLKR